MHTRPSITWLEQNLFKRNLIQDERSSQKFNMLLSFHLVLGKLGNLRKNLRNCVIICLICSLFKIMVPFRNIDHSEGVSNSCQHSESESLSPLTNRIYAPWTSTNQWWRLHHGARRINLETRLSWFHWAQTMVISWRESGMLHLKTGQFR